MKKVLFIMNPVSGQKRANWYLLDIINLFNRAGYEVTVHITGGRGDARQTAANRARGMDLVVCCGGDGTLNEVISGLLQSYTEVPVGYIPSGSTNDFAASLKLPRSIMQSARAIVEGEAVPYDVGRFGSRYFSYVASFGAFTRASYNTPQNVKNALGHTAYLLGGIQELSQIRKEHVRIELEDQIIEDDFLFGAICNSTSVGGILTLDPGQVDMSDGLMELLLVRMPRNLAEITECIQAVQAGRYNDCAMITFCSARKMKIYASPTMTWTLDGEREEGHSEITVENLRHAIRLMQKVDAP